MKLTATLTTLCALFLAGPAFAGEGYVPQSTLNSIGLGGMQVLSDDEGMEIRGQSAAAAAWGTSIVSGLLLDPATKSFVLGTDANIAKSTALGKSKHGVKAFQSNYSSVDLSLIVDTNVSSFVGALYGGAGGQSFATVK